MLSIATFTRVMLVSVLVWMLTASAAAAHPPHQPSPSAIWFADMTQPLVSRADDNAALVHFIAASVMHDGSEQPDFPTVFASDNLPRIVFLSVSDGMSRAHVAHGSGLGLASAVDQAVTRLESHLSGDYTPEWLKVDIVQAVTPVPQAKTAEPLEHERSLYGLAFGRQTPLAFLPEELVAAQLVNNDHYLEPEHIAAYLSQWPDQAEVYQSVRGAETINLYRFTTTSLFWDGNAVIPLYRGHRVLDEVTPADLYGAALRGADYLMRAVETDGKFVYSYRPDTNNTSAKYNILRHAGTIYSMLEVYEITRDPALLEAAERAIGYLIRTIQPCSTRFGTLPCVVEAGHTKLGGNGLAAVALEKYTEVTGDQQHIPLLRGLGRWMQSVQDDSGAFTVHKQTYPGGVDTGFVSQYYPGEAILALNRIYALDPDPSWLDSAEAAAQYLITVRDGARSDAELPHDHWLLYGLNDLYRYRPDALYATHAMRIAGAIVASQHRDPLYPDWRGGFYYPPRSTPTATRMEGLCAAYHLAQAAGDTTHPDLLLEAMRLGSAFQLQTQIRPESALYFRDPQRALGGFHHSFSNFEIRIDYVQHNISSLVCIQQVLERQAPAPSTRLFVPLVPARQTVLTPLSDLAYAFN